MIDQNSRGLEEATTSSNCAGVLFEKNKRKTFNSRFRIEFERMEHINFQFKNILADGRPAKMKDWFISRLLRPSPVNHVNPEPVSRARIWEIIFLTPHNGHLKNNFSNRNASKNWKNLLTWLGNECFLSIFRGQ